PGCRDSGRTAPGLGGFLLRELSSRLPSSSVSKRPMLPMSREWGHAAKWDSWLRAEEGFLLRQPGCQILESVVPVVIHAPDVLAQSKARRLWRKHWEMRLVQEEVVDVRVDSLLLSWVDLSAGLVLEVLPFGTLKASTVLPVRTPDIR